MANGRFAPSPTGRLHLGNLRTALVAWLFARSSGGQFLIRFDDLDSAAVRAEHYRSQLDDLAAIGLDWDAPAVRQSDRVAFYRRAIDRLILDEAVYPCYCTRREIQEAVSAPNKPLAGRGYPGTCSQLDASGRAKRGRDRRPALRFRAGAATIGFVDMLAGPVVYEVDDFVIERNDGTPAYHLVTVLDDTEQGVQMVVRADDLLDSTCRQLLLADTFGLPRQDHAHVPLVLGSDGERLAKRHGAVTLSDRIARGQSPAAVVGFLASSLGIWPSGEPVDPYTLLDRFDPDLIEAEPLQLDEEQLGPGDDD